MQGKNVSTIRGAKQSQTSADDSTIEVPEGCESPYLRSD